MDNETGGAGPRERQRQSLADALRAAEPATLHGIQPAIAAFARDGRQSGMLVTDVLREIKELIRDHAGRNADVFLPRVVGWTVAAYYAGT